MGSAVTLIFLTFNSAASNTNSPVRFTLGRGADAVNRQVRAVILFFVAQAQPHKLAQQAVHHPTGQQGPAHTQRRANDLRPQCGELVKFVTKLASFLCASRRIVFGIKIEDDFFYLESGIWNLEFGI